ncbi:sugar phosphate isomerase [Methanobrevibacter sp. 87.7]|uniref:sugar phosphate isomerase/epimerase family protein n=1 Tax=Methanobrevibacter sp. 87.7 TaxID=387957 RepID=UPI000B50E965|nr:sugar phosphate isomerase/epimerase family protein [Methanobrevibacter sp. 87.7]OWT33183.1 sugar phosphate isomerase [Methanobrevibacter sp. 87.7]
MKLGFSTLSLFMKPIQDMINIGKRDGFELIELLSEGPYIPYNLLEHEEILNNINNKGIELYIHGPNVDINLASLNKGIREESIKQICETIDLADKLNGKAITVHAGQVGRNDERIRKVVIDYAIESINKCIDYGKDNNKKVKISVENLPNRFNFIGNSVSELEYIQENTGSSITIDTGHANTCKNCREFFDLNNIIYYHIHDNDGKKDQHLVLKEGNLDLNLLKKVDNGIIELNNYENVLKTKNIIEELNLRN